MKYAVLVLTNTETNETIESNPIYGRRAESPEALDRLAKNWEKEYAYNLIWEEWVKEGKIVRGNSEENKMVDWQFVDDSEETNTLFEKEVDSLSKKFKGGWKHIED